MAGGMVEVARATVTIVPNMRGAQGEITKGLAGIGSAGDAAGSKLGSSIASKIKTAIVAAKIGKTLADALNEGAKYQQSVGGVETMFKDSADTVIKNAEQAYKTAGVSANTYMEQVTSFSAALLKSLGDDTVEAANYADRAITDMSDNANKFGTDIDSIQRAYQGFAKGNYTMLDNLKLGYGGTKTEMQKLIADAASMTSEQEKLNVTVQKGSLEFGNVVNAISVMQEHLGITGTTAAEASQTFSGSMEAMKASWQNVLAAVTGQGDLTAALEGLGKSVGNFINGNLLPMLDNIVQSIPKVLESVAPAISGMLPSLVNGIVQILTSLAGVLVQNAPILVEGFMQVATAAIAALGQVDWSQVGSKIMSAIGAALNQNAGVTIAVMAGLGLKLAASLGGGLTTAMSSISSIFGSLSGTLKPAASALGEVGSAAASSGAGAAGAAAGFGQMAGAALMIVGIGAGFALAGAGMKLMAEGAVEIGNAGFPAAAAMLEIVASFGALLAIAGTLGAGLTAAAGGLAAFGLAAVGVGLGIAAATLGLSLLTLAFTELVRAIADSSDEISQIIDHIGQAIETTFTSIGEMVATVVGSIGSSISAIVESIGTSIATVAESIGTTMSNVATSVGNSIATILDSVGGVIESIGTSIGTVIEAIGSAISGIIDSVAGVFDSIGQAAVNCGQGMQTLADGISQIVALNLLDLAASMAAVAGGIAEISANAKDLTATASGIEAINSSSKNLTATATVIDSFSASLDKMVASAAPKMDSFAATMDSAVTTIKTDLQQLANAFKSTKLEFNQKIKLPKFRMNGKFDAQTGSVPTVSVSWYAKAAEQGALFSSPQVIGVGDSRQPEMLIGEQTLTDKIAEAVGGTTGDVYVYIGDQQLDAIIQRSNQRTAMRRGTVGAY